MKKHTLHYFALLALVSLLAGCGSLPTDFDKPVSQALVDTSESQLARNLQPLLANHPGKSGFRTLNTGEEAFIARLRMIQSATQSLDVQ